MTEAEYNEALKELGVVLLDIDYTKLKTILDVAKIVIHLDLINERLILEDNDIYQKENEELKAQIDKMKCCQNCKHYHIDYEGKMLCKIVQQYKTCKKWEIE